MNAPTKTNYSHPENAEVTMHNPFYLSHHTANNFMRLLGRYGDFKPEDPAMFWYEGHYTDLNYNFIVNHLINEVRQLKEEVRALRDTAEYN